ncbi:MAG: hypothetical protein HQ483_15130 [Rhodospirillales bacterium]|nr:hypothetical protein [Rhodospirillales bacterium]
MLARTMPETIKFPFISRRIAVILVLVVGFPILLLAIARLLSTDLPKAEVMEVARAVLEEHVRRNPPNGTWQMTATRVTDQDKLEMDVDVADYDKAKFIMSRTGRIRHSYMKLACPELEADVYRQLPKNETVWIQLHYNGEPIVSGACPLAKSLF